jgi:hypothetical protein
MVKKIKFGVYLDPFLAQKFRQFVAEQYGKVSHGLLSFEVAQALQAWMSTHKSTQTQLVHLPPNPIPNVFMVREQVKTYLKDTLGYDQIYKIPKSHLILAISALRGTDQRTIKKWIKLFEKYKVIKWVTPAYVEFL